jgi:UDP-N-acetyl-D-mannosaminuronic acid dehydrogenase
MDNTYRDIQFAVANEFAQVIEEISEDANRVISIANSGYGRTNISKPGLVGGPCLEKDPIIFAQSAKAFGVEMPITMAARTVNQNSIHHGISRITNYFDKNEKKIEKILIFGLAFKGNPSTSDTRGSLAIPFINTMKKKFNEVKIFGYDKHVMKLDMMGIDCTLVDNFYTAAENSDLVVIQHDAQYIKDIDLNKISNLMNNNGLIYDFWNLHSMSSLTMQNNVSYLSYGSLMGEQ